jgi:hypothetical protein
MSLDALLALLVAFMINLTVVSCFAELFYDEGSLPFIPSLIPHLPPLPVCQSMNACLSGGTAASLEAGAACFAGEQVSCALSVSLTQGRKVSVATSASAMLALLSRAPSGVNPH